MDRAMMIWRMLVAGVAIWRLSRLFLEETSNSVGCNSVLGRQESSFCNRTLDCICWLSVWLSGQTAIWVVGGVVGVLMNWLALASLSHLLIPSAETANESALPHNHPVQLRTEPLNGDLSCLSVERVMQVSRG